MARHTRRRRVSPLRVAILVLAALLLILLAVAILFTLGSWLFPAKVHRELTVEAGVSAVDPNRFLVEEGATGAVFQTVPTAAQLTTPGSYGVVIVYNDKTYDAKLTVEDTVAPQAVTTDLSALSVQLPEAADFITEFIDATDVTAAYKTQPDAAVAGEQAVTLVLTDTSGNQSEVTAKLTVIIDTVAPMLSGVQKHVLYLGDAVSYRTGVTVSDDHDPAPNLLIDSSGVDLSRAGQYPLTYTATDSSGNSASVQTTVTVLEKKAEYVDIETIYQAADALLATIVTADMDQRTQVERIYKWARTNCTYSGHSDKNDYLQGAYVMMTQRTGDCFNYFAVTKLFFERLGIQNMDVRKVKNHAADSDHYWSLVSLDGENWYHFDATPRMGEGDDFCLVTDAFLDTYSAAHSNCHNRDKSLYPATPEV